ncbi:ABC transporter substrate-binding protein [Brevibacillus panacihumi W25]|uniref:ABC transporter substrate-binding protein n=1 Tax=Brevibacillus panacihumi W25 TaxID=1408254 RepID=V6MDV0_9BACL|nr:ABC transporter substrate-binding protein [Brevibacillus panacihumi]EST53548.1 ABC transporter substrate-binding protein [Brevibacillus panacihumi W25]
MRIGKRIANMLCITALIVLSACSGGGGQTPSANSDATNTSQPKADPGKANQVFIGITNAPGSLNPINATDVTSNYLTWIMFEPLMELDPTLKFVPRLADSIETNDNQTYIAKLNQQAKWTDGQAFTAEDVLFTFQTIGNPNVMTSLTSWTPLLAGFDEKGQLAQGQTDIEGVKIIDPNTVEFRTKTPVDPNLFLEQIGRNIRYLPKHILKDVDMSTLHQNEFMQKLNVSTGAFKFVSYQKDQFVELEANKDYYRGAPKLERIFFKIMPSANIVAQLQSGEIDMNVPGIGNIAVQDFQKVQEMKHIISKAGQPTNYQMVFFNTNTFPDVRVRQALAYAMNREMMVKSLLRGQGQVTDLPFTSMHPYYNKDLKGYGYDPEKAKQLLQEANWDFSKQINIQVPSGNKTREQTADIMAENFKAVGLNAQVQKYDMPTHIQRGKKGEFDLFFLGLTFELDPNSINSYFNSQSTWNLSGYTNPEMDALLQQGREETDAQKRKETYNKIQELILRDLPQISLYADYRLLAVNKRILVGEPREVGMFINMNEWETE